MPRGDGGFWLGVWHEERFETPPTFDTRNEVEASRWRRLELPGGELSEETTLPWHGGSAQAFLTGGRTYSSFVAADYSSAIVYDMSAPEGPQPGITVRGGLYGISQLRQGDGR